MGHSSPSHTILLTRLVNCLCCFRTKGYPFAGPEYSTAKLFTISHCLALVTVSAMFNQVRSAGRDGSDFETQCSLVFSERHFVAMKSQQSAWQLSWNAGFLGFQHPLPFSGKCHPISQLLVPSRIIRREGEGEDGMRNENTILRPVIDRAVGLAILSGDDGTTRGCAWYYLPKRGTGWDAQLKLYV